MSAAIEKAQVQGGSKADGTTLQLEVKYVTGWQLHFSTIGYFPSLRRLRNSWSC